MSNSSIATHEGLSSLWMIQHCHVLSEVLNITPDFFFCCQWISKHFNMGMGKTATHSGNLSLALTHKNIFNKITAVQVTIKLPPGCMFSKLLIWYLLWTVKLTGITFIATHSISITREKAYWEQNFFCSLKDQRENPSPHCTFISWYGLIQSIWYELSNARKANFQSTSCAERFAVIGFQGQKQFLPSVMGPPFYAEGPIAAAWAAVAVVTPIGITRGVWPAPG